MEAPGRIRVVVVDDAADMRLLLRLQFERDPRFEVVGEGADGEEAIALAEEFQPDLIVLDRQMPTLGGVEAIPEIRSRAAGTAIILYSAQVDALVHRAALAAGALEVLDKAAAPLGFVDQLVDTLLGPASGPDANVEVHVGPVAAAAARTWVANTTTIIDAVAAHPEVLEEPIPKEVLALFRSLLEQWRGLATTSEEDFRWTARASPSDVARIVSYWAVIDRLTDDQLSRLGIRWSPPEGEPFFHALSAGVLDALRRHEQTRRLATSLGEQWSQ